MKSFSLAALLLVMLPSSSCLPSLQSLVTYDNVTEDNRIIGTWLHDNTDFKVEKLEQSAIYNEIVEGIDVKEEDGQEKKPLTTRLRQDSILNSHAYAITYHEEDITYYLLATLTKVNTDLFIQLNPIVIDDPQSPNGSGLDYTFDYLSAATFAKVVISNNNMVQLQFADGDHIKDLIQKGNMRIKHESDNLFGTFLVTASTRDLRSFFEKYSHDERFFSKKNSFTLTRKG